MNSKNGATESMTRIAAVPIELPFVLYKDAIYAALAAGEGGVRKPAIEDAMTNMSMLTGPLQANTL